MRCPVAEMPFLLTVHLLNLSFKLHFEFSYRPVMILPGWNQASAQYMAAAEINGAQVDE